MEKQNAANLKETNQKIQNLKAGLEDVDQRVEGARKQISSLDDKIRSFIKNAALTGGGNYGSTNVVEEIEDSIQKVRDDLDELKKHSNSELVILRNDLNRKFT